MARGIKVGDLVIASGFKAKRTVVAIDGKYAYIKGIGWGLKSAVLLVERKQSKKGEG